MKKVIGNDTLVAMRYARSIPKEQVDLEFVEYDRNWNEKKVVKHHLPGITRFPTRLYCH